MQGGGGKYSHSFPGRLEQLDGYGKTATPLSASVARRPVFLEAHHGQRRCSLPTLFSSCSPVYTDHSRSSACVAPALYRFTQRAIPELAAQHRPQSLPQTTLASPASRSTLERLGRHSRWVHRTPLAGFSGPATHQHQSLRGKPLSSIVSPSPWSAPLPTGHTSPLPSPSTTTNATCRPSTASRSRFPLPGTV